MQKLKVLLFFCICFVFHDLYSCCAVIFSAFRTQMKCWFIFSHSHPILVFTLSQRVLKMESHCFIFLLTLPSLWVTLNFILSCLQSFPAILFVNRYSSTLFHLTNYCPDIVFTAGSVTRGREVRSFLFVWRRELLNRPFWKIDSLFVSPNFA